MGNWIRITKGLSAECQTPSGVFEGKGFGEHGQAYFEMLVLRLKKMPLPFAVLASRPSLSSPPSPPLSSSTANHGK